MPAIIPIILSMIASTAGHAGVRALLGRLGTQAAKSGAGKIGEIAARQITPAIGKHIPQVTVGSIGRGGAELASMLGGLGAFELTHRVLDADDGESAVAQGSASMIHADQPAQLQSVALQSALEEYMRGSVEEDAEMDRMLNHIVMNAPQMRRLV